MKSRVLGMSIYFEKPTHSLFNLGGTAYEQGLVMWDEECLLHHLPQTMSTHTSIISMTVICIMGARVKFKRAVSASLCLETQGYQLMMLIPWDLAYAEGGGGV